MKPTRSSAMPEKKEMPANMQGIPTLIVELTSIRFEFPQLNKHS
jgi:hypothetical protein